MKKQTILLFGILALVGSKTWCMDEDNVRPPIQPIEEQMLAHRAAEPLTNDQKEHIYNHLLELEPQARAQELLALDGRELAFIRNINPEIWESVINGLPANNQ